MDVGFGTALLFAGGLLAIAAALSGLMRGTVLSISILSVTAGVILAEAGTIHVDATDSAVIHLFLLALIVTLLSDGLFVERELLVVHWGPVVRALVIAMPLTLGLLAVAAKLLFSELSWAEAFLLGAVLSATDPVVTSAVVTSQRVPAAVRHALNLESGLNDGLALPFVLFFIVLASPGGNSGTEAAKLLGEAAFGALIGVVLGQAGGRLTHHLPGGGIVRRYEGIYALGLGLLAYGIADVTFGNGLIAAFVCGISLAVADTTSPMTSWFQRERQLDPPGADLLRLRGADRRHRLPRQHPPAGRLHRLRHPDREARGDPARVHPRRSAQAHRGFHRVVRTEGGRLDALR